ncbi:hypothetical protein AVEN_274469-1 [Araneus ventricosus]|uniref:Uncharacterized protein n=1 Tax=Araneus ventricosus TaxID=182803 RepID=A0A4Y2HCP3_ARAVE|nr:hypothetical protein AVEN_274469-1 [Araneus ventricosus]
MEYQTRLDILLKKVLHTSTLEIIDKNNLFRKRNDNTRFRREDEKVLQIPPSYVDELKDKTLIISEMNGRMYRHSILGEHILLKIEPDLKLLGHISSTFCASKCRDI